MQQRILEGIVTTLNDDATTNVAPMGPYVDDQFVQMVFRPFRTSSTYQNLARTGGGVFHVVDDVELLARAAVDQFDSPPELLTLDDLPIPVLADSCRWYAFQIVDQDDTEERARLTAHVHRTGRLRDFFGLNRAQHAVVEAAILATRVQMLSPTEIRQAYERLALLVEKTGGPLEHRAFDLLCRYVETYSPTLHP